MSADKRRRGRRPGSQTRAAAGRREDSRYWLFGRHAVVAACANPRRRLHRVLALAPQSWPDLSQPPEAVGREELDRLLPPGVVHQGIAALAEPLDQPSLSEACAPRQGERSLAVVLDQVEDVQNVGTILRSAAAFGARAVILPSRHAPPESGLMARAAAGMLERVPLIRVTNLVRALEDLAELGYWRFGLSADAPVALHRADWSEHVALVVGAEGRGLRRLTAEACDGLLSIAMAPDVESLNVAAAAAIALHEVHRAKP